MEQYTHLQVGEGRGRMLRNTRGMNERKREKSPRICGPTTLNYVYTPQRYSSTQPRVKQYTICTPHRGRRYLHQSDLARGGQSRCCAGSRPQPGRCCCSHCGGGLPLRLPLQVNGHHTVLWGNRDSSGRRGVRRGNRDGGNRTGIGFSGDSPSLDGYGGRASMRRRKMVQSTEKKHQLHRPPHLL